MSKTNDERQNSQTSDQKRKSSLSSPNNRTKASKDDTRSSDIPVKVLTNARPSTEEQGSPRRNSRTYKKRNTDRVEWLARPHTRRLRSLWDEKYSVLPPERRDKIKSALEEDYFLSPEQTEMYFQSLRESGGGHYSRGNAGISARKERAERERELRQRQKWLINFSAQVAYQLCEYISKGQKEMLVSNRLRSIADVVLERVAEILGEPKPSRTQSNRLARFMVAVSDRIAVWIENAVYRADALEPVESTNSLDEHMRLDNEKSAFV